ncbi:MAG: rRNA maturation RNase YbeY [Candidatus Omnitrophica bacterium]|nr:rRNA maturation RNase YbeY [Candidatus Omnitrophota bacterium]
MKIEITNRQKIKRVNLKTLSKSLEKAAGLLLIPSKTISLTLVDNAFIVNLNKRYLKKTTPTDVISFDLSDPLDPDYLGEIVVSVEEAVKVAKSLKVDWQKEVLLYCLHGILHLIGYDDRSKKKRDLIEKKQKELMEKLWLKKT